MKARQKQINAQFEPTGDASKVTDALRVAAYNRNKEEFRESNHFEGHKASVTAVAFSPNGETIATASADNTAKLWNRQENYCRLLKGMRIGSTVSHLAQMEKLLQLQVLTTQ
jgi:WD40 repeat protein